MDALLFWLRCLSWAFRRTERAEGMTATLLVVANWGAVLASLGIVASPLPSWVKLIAPGFLALMLLVVAPYQLYRRLEERRAQEVQEVWDKNDALRKRLGQAKTELAALSTAPQRPQLQIRVQVFRVGESRLLLRFQVSNSGPPSSLMDWGVGWIVGDVRTRLRIEDHRQPVWVTVDGEDVRLEPAERIEDQTTTAIENGGARVGWMLCGSAELTDDMFHSPAGRLAVTHYATVAGLERRPLGSWWFRRGPLGRWWIAGPPGG